MRRNPSLLSIVACWRPRVSPRAFTTSLSCTGKRGSAQEDALSVVVPRASHSGRWQCFYADSAWFPRRGSHGRVLACKSFIKPVPTDAPTRPERKKHKIRSAPGSPPHLQGEEVDRDPPAPRTCAASRARTTPRASATWRRSTPRAGRNVMFRN